MSASPYDGPDTSSRRDKTTVWRDGEVVRCDPWGRVKLLAPIPPLTCAEYVDRPNAAALTPISQTGLR